MARKVNKIKILVDKSLKMMYNWSVTMKQSVEVRHRGCGGRIEVVMSEYGEIKFECSVCHATWVPADKERNIWLPDAWVSYEKHGVKNG